ncbi:MAG: YdcF family protein [Rhodomicrobium sp.]|jgi:uncharacterized SAM-binding protein YcdF (DUF218 family)
MSTASGKKRPLGGFSATAIALHAARVTAVLCFAAAGGFFVFAYSVSVISSREPQSADGIVALTGDEDRISEAIRLLAEGKAHRLLISGVNKSTRAPEIIGLNTAGGKEADLFRCCVDLDKRALNTEDNAFETTAWVRSQGFHSLIVVTSTYHMPRTLMELRQAMPDLELVPYPVKSRRLEEQWWSDARTAWVLVKEYLKFITASLRYGANSVLGGGVKAEHRPPVINARVN